MACSLGKIKSIAMKEKEYLTMVKTVGKVM
jgi:hypothetical protein